MWINITQNYDGSVYNVQNTFEITSVISLELYREFLRQKATTNVWWLGSAQTHCRNVNTLASVRRQICGQGWVWTGREEKGRGREGVEESNEGKRALGSY